MAAETPGALCEVAAAVHAAYQAVGWSEDWAAEDSGLLAAQHVASLSTLRKALERGHLLASGTVCDVSLDVLAASLKVSGPRQALQFPAVMCRDVSSIDWHALSAVRITSLHVLSLVSRESWARVLLPAGVKVAVEDLALAPLATSYSGGQSAGNASTGGDVPRPLAAFLSPAAAAEPTFAQRPTDQQPGVLAMASVAHAQTPGRLVVTTADQRRYEIDRYCPHKGADLATAAVVDGHVVCPRHRWRFSLDAGGLCTNGKFPCTVNARVLDW